MVYIVVPFCILLVTLSSPLSFLIKNIHIYVFKAQKEGCKPHKGRL